MKTTGLDELMLAQVRAMQPVGSGPFEVITVGLGKSDEPPFSTGDLLDVHGGDHVVRWQRMHVGKVVEYGLERVRRP